MKTFFLLVLLSQNGAGDINASFVNTETLAQCRQKQALVKGVFSSANIPIIASRCIRSGLQFSKFAHTASSGKTRYFYLVRFTKEAVTIRKMPGWRSCMAKQEEGRGQGPVYCASSVQWLEE
ncbi:MAG TPA: hypothetical protein ENI99_11150 [Sedimenticola sp.]|nr:hypothetical protein [Sedimenticola sp.]